MKGAVRRRCSHLCDGVGLEGRGRKDVEYGCGACGAVLPVDAAWCAACGTPVAFEVARACAACGADLETGEAFCWRCGHALVGPSRATSRPARGESSVASHVASGRSLLLFSVVVLVVGLGLTFTSLTRDRGSASDRTTVGDSTSTTLDPILVAEARAEAFQRAQAQRLRLEQQAAESRRRSDAYADEYNARTQAESREFARNSQCSIDPSGMNC